MDRDSPMLLSPDMREWVPDTHIVHVILDALDHVSMAVAKVNARGTGSEQYPPLMMLGLSSDRQGLSFWEF